MLQYHTVYIHLGSRRSFSGARLMLVLRIKCRQQELEWWEKLEWRVWREDAATPTCKVWKVQVAIVLAVAMEQSLLFGV